MNTPAPEQNSLDSEVQSALAELGLANIDWKRRISAADATYLLDQCPFLQIMDTAVPLPEDLKPVQIIQARSGWKIHDYGHALSSSPGEFLYGMPMASRDDDDGGGVGSAISGSGTLINRAVLTAFEMVHLAKAHAWVNIQLVDGHPLMAWAAWMEALESNMGLDGYTPTAQDWRKRRRIKQSADRILTPRPSF